MQQSTTSQNTIKMTMLHVLFIIKTPINWCWKWCCVSTYIILHRRWYYIDRWWFKTFIRSRIETIKFFVLKYHYCVFVYFSSLTQAKLSVSRKIDWNMFLRFPLLNSIHLEAKFGWHGQQKKNSAWWRFIA